MRVARQIGGGGGHELTVLEQREMPRSPAVLLAQATRGLQSGEESMGHERIAVRDEGVPVGGRDVGEAVEETDPVHAGAAPRDEARGLRVPG